MDYFSKYDIAPLDAIPFFRPDEIKCIAEALSDLPRPIGGPHWTSSSNTDQILHDVYMTHTRGIIIKHLMEKIYAKNDLELLSRIQGALDDDMFRHNVYFILEILLQAEIEIRETATQNSADPDFSPLDNYHVESWGFDSNALPIETATFDWRYPEMSGNGADTLSNAYMAQILTGLNGGNPAQVDSLGNGSQD